METQQVGLELGTEEKGRAFAAYLEEIGLPVAQVLSDLGPAEVGDVVSFFYAAPLRRGSLRRRAPLRDRPAGRKSVTPGKTFTGKAEVAH